MVQKIVKAPGKFSNNDKKVIASGLIKEIKEQYIEVSSADVAAIFSTAYTLARKAANGKD